MASVHDGLHAELTVERMFNWFYWVVNIGALSPLITVNVEAHVSFWAAYLIPLVYFRWFWPLESEDHLLISSSVIVIAATVFVLGSMRFVKTPPHGSAVIDAVKIVTVAVKRGGFDNARPSALQARGALKRHHFAQLPHFTDKSVKDVQSGITAFVVMSKFIMFLAPYIVRWIQIRDNLISQAGVMALPGTSNDLLRDLKSIALIIFNLYCPA